MLQVEKKKLLEDALKDMSPKVKKKSGVLLHKVPAQAMINPSPPFFNQRDCQGTRLKRILTAAEEGGSDNSQKYLKFLCHLFHR